MKLLNIFALFFSVFIGPSLIADNSLNNQDDEGLAAKPHHNFAYYNFDPSSQFENKGMGGMGGGGMGAGRGGVSITSRGPYRGGGWPGWKLNPLNWPIYPGQPMPPPSPGVDGPSISPSSDDDADIKAEQRKVKKLQYLLDQKKLLKQLQQLDNDNGTAAPSGSASPPPPDNS